MLAVKARNRVWTAAMLTACLLSAVPQSKQAVYANSAYTLWPDRVVEGAYSARAQSGTEIVSNYPLGNGDTQGTRTWKLQEDLSRYPAFGTDSTLSTAVYNLSLAELAQDVSKGGTFDAGARWPGVWTRDTSYSILLSLAAVDPKTSQASLLRKVRRDRIVQDTGSGGSWPVSTDRVCWALAAWEIYLVTGDQEWLKHSEAILVNSIRDDEHVVMDPSTGLAHGESSFMDWREQTYPRWMEPADIYSSEDLGTNALFYRTYQVLGNMERELGRPDQEWTAKAERIRNAMKERLWISDRGLYGQYLYGRDYQTLSTRSDALGQALAVLFDIPTAEQQRSIIASQPFLPYGVPTVFPETPGIQPYHNRSVWPFIQAFWNLAAAKQDNEALLLYGLSSMYRSTALFLTNKENFVADTGSPAGTAVNSDRQLWSVAGSLGMVYRVFFGMDFATDGLHFRPVIPSAMRGTYNLTNFHYRDATLSITVTGSGSQVRRFTIDGTSSKAVLSPHLKGSHSIRIELDGSSPASQVFHLTQSITAPDTPAPAFQSGKLTWAPVTGAATYKVYRDGALASTVESTSFIATGDTEASQYQLAAISSSGEASFLSVPVRLSEDSMILPTVPGPGNGSSEAYVMLEQEGVSGLTVSGDLPHPGRFALAFRYANGSGSVTTDNKCAVRTLFIDGKSVGPIVMPQRGVDKWDDWGVSNHLAAQLSAGSHTFELRLLPQDLNMDGTINRARIAALYVTPLK